MSQHEVADTLPRLVIIESDPDAIALMETLFATAGLFVRAFTSVQEAMRSMPAITPDVIISSIVLKGLSGFQVCRQLRRLQGSANSYIIALTGLTFPGMDDACKQAGFDEYMLKPLTRNMLDFIVQLAHKRHNKQAAKSFEQP